MKTKICIIITAIIFFTASELTAIEDKIFTSSGQILPGEEWENVYIYNDDTIVDMLGGHLDSIGTYDASTVNVTGGHVNTLVGHEFSTANLSGGYVYGASARDSATVNLSDNGSLLSLSARGSFGTVNMTGGSTEYARAGDSGTLNLYGGVVTDSLNAWDSAVVNIYGYDLVKTSSGGGYNDGQVFGFWADGTAFTIDLNGSQTYSHINLFEIINVQVDIAPNTLNLQSEGKWTACRINLPKQYSVSDIDPDTILIERRVKAEWKWFNEKQNVVMAKFKRSELKEILEPGKIELIVSCHLLDGTYFEGTDTVRVRDKGRLRGRRVNSNSKVVDGIEYYIQTDKAVYNLGKNIKMLYRVTNLRDEEVLIGCSRSSEFNLLVQKDGETIWMKVQGWYWFSPGITLSAGESEEIRCNWDMKDNDGNLLEPGVYNVVGVMYNEPWNYYNHGTPIITKVAVPIKVVPEPKGRVKHN